jgi:calcineurin-like phosphoesterase family protein
MKVNKQIMWLSHYPMEIGLRPRKWSIGGHIHSEPSRYINQINVGVDSPLELIRSKPFGTPISLDELIEHMDSLTPEIEEYYTKLRG